MPVVHTDLNIWSERSFKPISKVMHILTSQIYLARFQQQQFFSTDLKALEGSRFPVTIHLSKHILCGRFYHGLLASRSLRNRHNRLACSLISICLRYQQ